jgi:Fe-S-cluster containining protein
LETDDARLGSALLERYTVLDRRGPGWRFVRNTGTRCAALDVSEPGRFPCAIYERRPDDCRIVEPGSPCCLEARRLGRLGRSVEFKRRP